jgi:protein-tyrosine phosphatase
MIEIHAHFLPGIDDGPQGIDDSLALINAFIADGITHAVATPHVYPGVFENTRSTIERAASRFRAELAARKINFQFSVAGEVRMDEHVIELYERGELPFLGASNGFQHLLLEMPDTHIPLGAEKLVAWLMARKVRPVIAHPERNRAIRDKPSLAKSLVDQGCLMQLSAGALTGGFGVRIEHAAHALMDLGAVHALASDAHNVGLRAPCLGSAHAWVRERYGDELAVALTRDNPARLCGMPVIGDPDAT